MRHFSTRSILTFGTNDIHVPRYPNERFRGEYDNMAEKNQLKVKFFRQILEEEKSKGTGMEL